jgi:hypothetical protein
MADVVDVPQDVASLFTLLDEVGRGLAREATLSRGAGGARRPDPSAPDRRLTGLALAPGLVRSASPAPGGSWHA